MTLPHRPCLPTCCAALLLALATGCSIASGPAAAGPTPPVQAASAALPTWLQRQIAGYQCQPLSSPPRHVLHGQYQGRGVYYVPPICCDIPSELYDEQGRQLCLPSGGFAGGDGRCRDFDPAAAGLTPVWTDPRGDAPGPRH
jgi:hypothetical protein